MDLGIKGKRALVLSAGGGLGSRLAPTGVAVHRFACDLASQQAWTAGANAVLERTADAIASLASKRAAYITGTTLRVDGGLIPAL